MPEDDAPGSAVPDPLDRLWLHPTEFGQRTRPLPRTRARRELAVAVAAGVAGALATVVILVLAGAFDQSAGPLRAAATTRPVDPELTARLATLVSPSVVAVATTSGGSTKEGSGVCLQSGFVLTSASLVRDADQPQVVTAATSVPARLVGVDPDTDLALLAVDALVPPMQPTATGAPRVGQTVVAVGARPGHQHWVSAGVVAALDSTATSASGAMLAGLIETDAAEAGNGGALVDRDGGLVGILTSDAKTSSGRGVAVPIDVAIDVAQQLRTSGQVLHGWIGVAVTTAHDDAVRGGVRVESVIENGPAHTAGVEVGDVITKIGGRSVDDMGVLLAEVARQRPGVRVVVTLVRAGKVSTKTITLADKATASSSATSG